MPPNVTCPACQHRFAGPEGAEAPSACPRCGAALTRTEVRPSAGDIRTTRPAAAALATTVCPACGKAVPELCLLCPHCEEPLAERHRVRRPGTEEGDSGPGLPPRVLWGMGFVGGMGVLISLLVSLVNLLAEGPGSKAGSLFFILLAIIAAALAVPVVLRRRSQAARAWMLFLGHSLAAGGCVITLGFAALLFAGVVCAALLR
jgi:hypothetical protein